MKALHSIPVWLSRSTQSILKTAVVAFGTLVLFSAAAALQAEPARVRVLTYNIHHGRGLDNRIDLERIARVILSAEPDLVALQEVDRNTGRSGGVDQAAELARLTDLSVVFGRAIDFDGGEYGDAVLSAHPVITSQIHPLAKITGAEDRVAVEVSVQLSGRNETLTLFATHLEHTAGETDRLAAVDRLERLVVDRIHEPILLAGDLNAEPESETMARFREKWNVAGRLLQTYPSVNPERWIDYVLYRPLQRWKVVEAKVLQETESSDHRPLLVVLEILE